MRKEDYLARLKSLEVEQGRLKTQIEALKTDYLRGSKYKKGDICVYDNPAYYMNFHISQGDELIVVGSEVSYSGDIVYTVLQTSKNLVHKQIEESRLAVV